MNWNGKPFGFFLRIDVEHQEAYKYCGDWRVTPVGTRLLLDLFDEMETKHTFCVVGITAEFLPHVIGQIRDAGHCITGHSMFHIAYGGRSLREQTSDMARMKRTIKEAVGVGVRGLAAPFHGLVDENTPQAAHDAGLTYLAGHSLFKAQSLLPAPMKLKDGQILVLNPPHPAKRGASDWTDRREGAPWFEGVFSPQVARQRWYAGIDHAAEYGGAFHLVVHPWMLHVNEGELYVVKDVIAYARQKEAWIGTWDDLITLHIDYQEMDE